VKRAVLGVAVSLLTRVVLAQPTEDPDPVPRAAFALGAERIDPFYGSFSTDIPIELPKYHGVEPSVSLSYNSGGGNGFVGVGWTLRGMSTIERVAPGNGSASLAWYGTAMVDTYALDGQEMVPCAQAPNAASCLAGGTHTTRMETYQRIRREFASPAPGEPAADIWSVWQKNGTRAIYIPQFVYTVDGVTPDTVRWGLRRRVDISGNQVAYAWVCNDGDGSDCYPSRIAYGHTIVDFVREPRPDVNSYAVTGSAVFDVSKRLKEIRVFSGDGATYPMVRAYLLSYATSGHTQRSILTRVEQVGRDTNINNYTNTEAIVGGTRLPPTLFTVPSTAPMGPVTFGEQQPWGPVPVVSTFSAQWFGDFNGDGKADLVFVPSSSDGYYVLLSRGSCEGGAQPCGFSPAEKWADFPPITDWRSVMVQDLNADGKDDVLYRSADATGLYAALSNGTSFQTPTRWSDDIFPSMLNPLQPQDYNALWLRDLNGDGLPDLFYVSSVPSLAIFARLNSGTGFSAAQVWADIPVDLPQTAKWVYPADYNGDGRTDFMYVTWDLKTQVLLSSGTRFTAPVQWGSIDRPPHPSAVRVADFNGDGRADILYLNGLSDAAGYRVMLSGGSAFDVATGWAPYEGLAHLGYDLFTPDLNGDGRSDLVVRYGNEFRARLNHAGQFAPQAATWGTRLDVPHLGAVWIQDFTGDGLPDLLQASGTGNVLVLAPNEGSAQADIIHALGNGLGGSMSLSYVRSNAWTRLNAAPFSQTVTSIAVQDGRGNQAVTSFAYEDALYSHVERRFLGFRHSTRTLPCVEGETQCPREELYFRQDIAAASRPLRTERRGGNDELLSSVEYGYATSGNTLPYVAHETSRGSTEFSGGDSRTVRSESAYDAFGNKTLDTLLGDVAVTGDERTMRTTYRPNVTTFVVGLPAATAVFAGVGTTGTVLEQGLFYYDQAVNSADGSGTWDAPPRVGRLTQTARWLNTSNTFVSKRMEYDTWGNVVETRDEENAVTTYNYDSTFRVREVLRSNSLNHVHVTQYDPVCALPIVVTDPNQQYTTTEYDALCRPVRTVFPAGGFITRSHLNLGDANAQRLRVQTPGPLGAGNLWRDVYFDGLGRTYRKVTRGPSSSQSMVEGTEVNARGKASAVTAVHYADQPAQVETTQYDALDRPVRVRHADGVEVFTSYGLGTVTTTDELGHITVVRSNVFGSPVQRQSMLASNPINTTFIYDVRQNLVGIEDHVGNRWTYQYDSLGRRTTEDDPDLGLRTYSFDKTDRPIVRIDAMGQRTETTYDRLGRPTLHRARVGTPQMEVTSRRYDQDRAGHSNIGRLTGMTDAAGTTEFDYDAMGRWQRKARTIDGQTYLFERDYDAGGRLLWQSYPDGDLMGSPGAPLEFDQAGRLSAIPGLVTSVLYSANGNMAVVTNHNGTVTTRGFAPERGWLTSLRTVRGTELIQDLTYTHDAEGKIVGIGSPFANESWTYRHDDLHRMTIARNLSSPSDTESFAYDAIGNLVERSRVGCYSYPAPGSPRPHAPLQAGGTQLSYNNNGNVVTRAGVPMVWDGLDRLVSYGADAFVYDPDGERVKRISNGETTLYPSDDYEVTSAGVVTKYFKVGTTTMAKRVNNATYWIHGDHLGSAQVVTSSTGNQVQRFAYRPYGERLSALTAHEQSTTFIGEHADPNGLVYLHARYMDPALGMFVSADPSWPMKEGVGLHRYAYGDGDPINRLDRSGLDWVPPSLSEPLFNGALGAIDGATMGLGSLARWAVNRLSGAELSGPDQSSPAYWGGLGIGAVATMKPSGALLGALPGVIKAAGVKAQQLLGTSVTKMPNYANAVETVVDVSGMGTKFAERGVAAIIAHGNKAFEGLLSNTRFAKDMPVDIAGVVTTLGRQGYEGGTVVLYSCWGAVNGTGQAVANALRAAGFQNVTVYAPTRAVLTEQLTTWGKWVAFTPK
jgi:RHS repeat-associated protein